MSIDESRPVTTDVETASAPSLSAETVSGIFADARSRTLVHSLEAGDAPLELDELARRVAAAEFGTDADAVPDDRYERVLVSLYEEHLPGLESAGLVDLSRRNGVFVAPNEDALAALV
ncbi:DUF7344 domain-containing protein [Halegenticoccus soli]|uniref:DUF7344 domain-containing protein n=1 Tax=Halegenticoccus soli TaxID=1985678 RepID=UPI000C6E8B6F|nr:hypothetical protein [Halegenticoccus soli]